MAHGVPNCNWTQAFITLNLTLVQLGQLPQAPEVPWLPWHDKLHPQAGGAKLKPFSLISVQIFYYSKSNVPNTICILKCFTGFPPTVSGVTISSLNWLYRCHLLKLFHICKPLFTNVTMYIYICVHLFYSRVSSHDPVSVLYSFYYGYAVFYSWRWLSSTTLSAKDCFCYLGVFCSSIWKT